VGLAYVKYHGQGDVGCGHDGRFPRSRDIEIPTVTSRLVEVIIFGEEYFDRGRKPMCWKTLTYVFEQPCVQCTDRKPTLHRLAWTTSLGPLLPTWNRRLRREFVGLPDIDIYHINDYYGALVSYNLTPKFSPICLSLTMRSSGSLGLRTKEEMKEVCPRSTLQGALSPNIFNSATRSICSTQRHFSLA